MKANEWNTNVATKTIKEKRQKQANRMQTDENQLQKTPQIFKNDLFLNDGNAGFTFLK